MCFLELIVRKTSPLELNMLLKMFSVTKKEIDNIKMYISFYDGFYCNTKKALTIASSAFSYINRFR